MGCGAAFVKRFSPLHEGDTSVVTPRTARANGSSSVSVPFTRGTPPWSAIVRVEYWFCHSFSPLHEGDTSVVGRVVRYRPRLDKVSVPFTRGTPPWCGGDRHALDVLDVSVPFTRGTPPWSLNTTFLPSRNLCFSPLHEGDTSVVAVKVLHNHVPLVVSVPFTRGTPPW